MSPAPRTRRPGAYLARAALALTLGVSLAATRNAADRPTGEERQGTRVPGTPEPSAAALAHRLRDHVVALAGTTGRPWSDPAALRAAAAYVQSTWEAQGYRVERQEIPGLGDAYVNLLAFGGLGSWEGAPLVVAAHYDTVEGTPGADDNASGVAVLLETSRLLTPARAAAGPVVFAALTLEEPPFFQTPRQGAWVLARSLRRQGIDLAGALVLEMVGYYRPGKGTQAYPFPLGLLGYPDRGDFVGLVANLRSRRLLAPLAGAIERAGLPVETLPVPGRGRLLPAVRLSDHAAFWDLGYRAVMLTDTSFFRNPHYHGPGDTPETLDYLSMARLTQGLAEFLGSAGPTAGTDARTGVR
ncbi:MAG: M28 family peptidase [Deferrisomatales bacterium]